MNTPSDSMKEIAGRLLQAKKERRRSLAALPIEQKIAIVVQMQRIANEIRRKTGRKTLPEWQIDPPKSAEPPR